LTTAAPPHKTLLEEEAPMRWLALTLALATLGCSGGDEMTPDEFVAFYPEAYCGYLMRCCDPGERSYGSKPICEQAIGDMVKELLAFRESATPFAAFLPGSAKACVDRLKSAGCTDDKRLTVGCMFEAVAPHHKAGEECTQSSECESFYCIQPQKNVKGSCGSSGGSQCSGDSRACSEGSYCKDGRSCVPKIEHVKPCSSGFECQSGICSSSTKVCVAKIEPWCDG
jgi:hypothetical protein